MISYDEALALMRIGVPGFIGSPEEAFVDADDGAYIHIAYIVNFVLRRLGEGDSTPAQAAVAVAERLLAEGDGDAQTLAEVGFVEDLTNTGLWPAGLSASVLLEMLGPRCRATRYGVQLAGWAAAGVWPT